MIGAFKAVGIGVGVSGSGFERESGSRDLGARDSDPNHYVEGGGDSAALAVRHPISTQRSTSTFSGLALCAIPIDC